MLATSYGEQCNNRQLPQSTSASFFNGYEPDQVEILLLNPLSLPLPQPRRKLVDKPLLLAFSAPVFRSQLFVEACLFFISLLALFFWSAFAAGIH